MLHKVHFGEFLFTFNFIQRNIFFLLHSDTATDLHYFVDAHKGGCGYVHGWLVQWSARVMLSVVDKININQSTDKKHAYCCAVSQDSKKYQG